MLLIAFVSQWCMCDESEGSGRDAGEGRSGRRRRRRRNRKILQKM